MYCVYWTSLTQDISGQHVVRANSRTFASSDIQGALHWCEQLRTERRCGVPHTFICLSSEDPNSVGESGVNDTLPVGYDWTKRR